MVVVPVVVTAMISGVVAEDSEEMDPVWVRTGVVCDKPSKNPEVKLTNNTRIPTARTPGCALPRIAFFRELLPFLDMSAGTMVYC